MTSKHFPSKPDHIPELDGLRGLAILAVLFYHFFWFPSDPTHWPKFFSLLWKLGQIGWVGVNLFFVLSGFLITRILLAQKGSHSFFKDFYWRRALRILPLYFLTLLFIGFYYPSSGPFVLFSLFFLSNAVELW
ncbi:MAG: acyltransferase, partial [Proteobacteria bacterium]|nr:acyltransferase [Pseudomonadota bacterium]